MKDNSTLALALLGLLHADPKSGYDLRKVFASTPMGSFSDSPGAIYPALARLEKQGMVSSEVEGTGGLRRRRLYRPTPKGTEAFRAWLEQPVTADEVIHRMDHLMLRFAFMDPVLRPERIARFLRALQGAIAAYLPTLHDYLDAHAREMTRSGRLALECGIREYALQLEWARSAAELYEQRRRKEA